ncbi:hypothetical protein [Rhodococcus marinonascens]|uniref:hypothetical protein n=1 Tax=Rhodococcus marinonascens TaxID=38311 RepID=UPI0009329D71|nr:hypothetical protein [Rhodococcus marinonascens]
MTGPARTDGNGCAPLPPPVQILGSAVLIQGGAVGAVRYAVAVTQRARARNGLASSGVLAHLLAALDTAHVSDAGQSDAETVAVKQDSVHAIIDPIGAEEVAGMHGCSARQARRLAPDLDGRISGGRWVFDRRTVTEYAQNRNAS